MTQEVFEGKVTGTQYSPLEKNKIFYEYLQQISLEKERESIARKSVTASIKWLAQEFGMEKDDVTKWVALKLTEATKGSRSMEAAVELNNGLKHNREVYGNSCDVENRIEREGGMTLHEVEVRETNDEE